MAMTGEALRGIRRKTGMSQAEFAAEIGLARETVSRMERDADLVDRRTELAARFIGEHGPQRTVMEIHAEVHNLLDQAAVRGRIELDGSARLRTCAAEWTAAGGGEVGEVLLRQAQGTIGMLNSSSDADPIRPVAFAQLRELKLAWSALRAALIEGGDDAGHGSR